MDNKSLRPFFLLRTFFTCKQSLLHQVFYLPVGAPEFFGGPGLQFL